MQAWKVPVKKHLWLSGVHQEHGKKDEYAITGFLGTFHTGSWSQVAGQEVYGLFGYETFCQPDNFLFRSGHIFV